MIERNSCIHKTVGDSGVFRFGYVPFRVMLGKILRRLPLSPPPLPAQAASLEMADSLSQWSDDRVRGHGHGRVHGSPRFLLGKLGEALVVLMWVFP